MALEDADRRDQLVEGSTLRAGRPPISTPSSRWLRRGFVLSQELIDALVDELREYAGDCDCCRVRDWVECPDDVSRQVHLCTPCADAFAEQREERLAEGLGW